MASFEQSLLINPAQPDNYVHLGELLLARLRENDRAVRVMQEARRHFPNAPQITYLLAVALREAKHSQEAVTTFGEALHEREAGGQGMVNDRFFFEYGAAAERAGLYDKAADLFKRAIDLDPNFASAYAMAARSYPQRMASSWTTNRAHEIAETSRLANRSTRRSSSWRESFATATSSAGPARRRKRSAAA